MISLRRALISDLDSIAKVATASLESTYKGVMISKANASKDMFKIDLLNMLQNK